MPLIPKGIVLIILILGPIARHEHLVAAGAEATNTSESSTLPTEADRQTEDIDPDATTIAEATTVTNAATSATSELVPPEPSSTISTSTQASTSKVVPPVTTHTKTSKPLTVALSSSKPTKATTPTRTSTKSNPLTFAPSVSQTTSTKGRSPTTSQLPTTTVGLSDGAEQKGSIDTTTRNVLIAFGAFASVAGAVFLACYCSRRKPPRNQFQPLDVDDDLLNYESGIHTMDSVSNEFAQTSFMEEEDNYDEIIYDQGQDSSTLTRVTTFDSGRS